LRRKLSFALSCLALFIIMMVIGGIHVASQGSLCYFTSSQIIPGQDASVAESQRVQFDITLTGSCSTPGLYTIRADIVSPGSSEIIATARSQLQANGQFIMALSESALAPSALGPWSLQLNAYILFNGVVVAPASQQLFGLNVVPYTPPTTAQTIESITQTSVTASSSIESASGSTSVSTTLSQLQSMNSQNQAIEGGNGGLWFEIQLIVAALAIVTIVIILLMARRKSGKTEHTRVY